MPTTTVRKQVGFRARNGEETWPGHPTDTHVVYGGRAWHLGGFNEFDQEPHAGEVAALRTFYRERMASMGVASPDALTIVTRQVIVIELDSEVRAA